jgi:hypothetical protein
MILHDLQRALATADDGYYRLVLLVGTPQSGKTARLHELARETGHPLVSLGGRAALSLLEYGDHQRRQRVSGIVAELVAEAAEPIGASVVLLDDIELLFAPSLAVDPLRLLQTLARNRIVVASWSGTLVGDTLSYADPAHPEYRTYRAPEAILVPVTVLAAGGAPTAPPVA